MHINFLWRIQPSVNMLLTIFDFTAATEHEESKISATKVFNRLPTDYKNSIEIPIFLASRTFIQCSAKFMKSICMYLS